MPAEILVTREGLAEDAIFILAFLRDNLRAGRSTHMMDVRNEVANSVTLEFSDYLRFLRKHSYVQLDREAHTLGLTPEGEKSSQQVASAQLLSQLEEFFASQLREGKVEIVSEEEESSVLGSLVQSAARPAGMPPPPPPEDLTPLPGPSPVIAARPPPPPTAAGAFAGVLGQTPTNPGLDASDELLYLRGEPLGQGPLGTVFRARHATLGTDVAVKEIRDQAARRFAGDMASLAPRLKAEMGAQARLRHPGILQILDLDLTVPQPFAVLELCEASLRERLKAQGGTGLEAKEALRAFGQMLAALAFAHARGVSHQNLKAENVLFDAFGNVKLGDFGLSRLLVLDAGDGSRPLMVDTGNMSYLAPELLSPGAGASGPSSDVYAAGILLYEMLTGRVPGRRSPLPSKAVAGVPEEMDEIFDRMTSDRPDERYESAQVVLEDYYAALPGIEYGQPGMVWVATQPVVAKPAPAPAKEQPASKPDARTKR